MKTSVGFWDALFGEKVEIHVPVPGGSVKKVQVTRRWLEQMQREGQIEPMPPPKVQVHILDPMGGMDMETILESSQEPQIGRVETWTIGTHVTADQYERFKDPRTGDLFVLVVYEAGKPKMSMLQRAMWERARETMANL